MSKTRLQHEICSSCLTSTLSSPWRTPHSPGEHHTPLENATSHTVPQRLTSRLICHKLHTTIACINPLTISIGFVQDFHGSQHAIGHLRSVNGGGQWMLYWNPCCLKSQETAELTTGEWLVGLQDIKTCICHDFLIRTQFFLFSANVITSCRWLFAADM